MKLPRVFTFGPTRHTRRRFLRRKLYHRLSHRWPLRWFGRKNSGAFCLFCTCRCVFLRANICMVNDSSQGPVSVLGVSYVALIYIGLCSCADGSCRRCCWLIVCLFMNTWWLVWSVVILAHFYTIRDSTRCCEVNADTIERAVQQPRMETCARRKRTCP